MKIAPRRRYIVNLESVAMTDIVLNMFIFFFISFSLLYTFNPSKAKHIKVNLPKAKNVASSKADADTVVITLSSEGPVYWQGEIVTAKELETRLGAAVKRNPRFGVILEVDRLVAFKNAVRVLDILNGLGVERLRISAQETR